MIRIASTNHELLKSFSLAAADVTPVPVAAATLAESLGAADLFLLSAEEALRLATASELRGRPTMVVTASEGAALPEAYARGFADDLLTLPLRALDVERVLRGHEQTQTLRALEETSRAVPAMVEKLEADIQLAQKIQRRLIREKFPPIGGLSIKSKYWCGLKAGGDYFDVFEFADGVHVVIILSDSSSYGLSTSFISSLLQSSVSVDSEELADPARLVRAHYEKIQEAMKEKDRFSVFYGILSRKTYQLRYVSCGNVFAAQKATDGSVRFVAKGENPALSKAQSAVPATQEAALEPGDRLLLTSDGWAEALGDSSPAIVEKYLRGPADAQDVMNEMAFHLRRGVVKHFELDETEEEDFPMPPQDCSVLLFDLAKNVLRLAR